MSLNIRPLEVDPEDPHANDALGRERDCLTLADLIGESGGTVVFLLLTQG